MNDVPQGMTRIIPMLAYEDVARTSRWLQQAFGFRERRRYADPDGMVSQAELEMDGGVLMIGNPGPAYQEPRHHGETCDAAQAWSEVPFVIDGVHVYVGDVDAHFDRAREVGATILSEPENTG
jgi:PhnB protein